MTTVWVIGDIQGCDTELALLLEAIQKKQGNQPYRLWFCGDLVNRGPDSVKVLRRVKNLKNAQTVLGNHDLFLLACAAGAREQKRGDTLDQILYAPDASELIAWLRRQPLAVFEHHHLLVHAGIHPCWDVQQVLRLANEVELVLRGDQWQENLNNLWGNTPSRFEEHLTGVPRLRSIVNIFSRMRFCSSDGTQDFKNKESIDRAIPGFMPWFEVPGRRTASIVTLFGHWSTLGLLNRPHLIGLDTGCVWGGKLTACRLHPDWTQREFVQIKSTGAVPRL